MTAKKKNKTIPTRWLKAVLTVFFVLSIAVFSYAYVYYVVYAQDFYPGTKMGTEDISGKNYVEALGLLNDYTEKVAENGFVYVYEDEKVSVLPIISSTEGSDIVHEIIKFDEKTTLDLAYDYGRNEGMWKNFLKHITALFSGLQVNIAYELDKEELGDIIRENFSKHESPAKNARLEIGETGDYNIILEEEGSIFDYADILIRTEEQINALDNKTIKIALEKDYPEVKKENTSEAISMIEEITALSPITLTHGEKKWEINKEKINTFLDFEYKNNEVGLGLNEKFMTYLSEEVAGQIDQEVKEGKFEIKDGKVKEFQASENGLSLDVEISANKIEEEVIEKNNREVSLVVKEVSPKVTTESINNLGVREIVGRGESDFSGSPRNRRHNIKVGAETLHGLLIKPDAEFSLVEALGNIDASTGYLPELVIKGNKTVPEYGGGLCQIGTTAFRLAIHTGLPITERKPHSYRVSYYEPAGFDATIYDPKPDLKFINNTGNYILLQTKIEGNKLTFEFYGTYDGRKIEVSKSTISNYVSPPPTKIVETDDLAPGEKKCTERAHTGATAVFYRTITMSDGTQEKETWSSVYKPWQEVCLVGKES